MIIFFLYSTDNDGRINIVCDCLILVDCFTAVIPEKS